MPILVLHVSDLPQVMVVKKKAHFYSLSKTKLELPPRLTMQVWDNDKFSPDEFIGMQVCFLCMCTCVWCECVRAYM